MNILRSCFGCFSEPVNAVATVNSRPNRDNVQNVSPRVGRVDPGSMRVFREAYSKAENRRKVQKDLWKGAGADERGLTPLHKAVGNGDVDKVKELCDSGVCIDIPDELDMTPLFHAVLKDHASIVSELLKRRASLISPDADETTLACLAARNGFEDVMRVLVDNNRESITFVSEKSGFSAVHEAARWNQVGILKLFAKLGINFNVNSRRMGSPVDAARRAQSWNALMYLKTPPRNDEAVQVIRGERRLTPENLKTWSQLKNASGIEDLKSVIYAVFVAWKNGDIDANSNEIKESLANVFKGTIGKVQTVFKPEEGRNYQLYCIVSMRELSSGLGLLNESANVDINNALGVRIDLNSLTEEVRADFRMCLELSDAHIY